MSNGLLQEFAELFGCCAVCGSDRDLHIHHLVGGAGRKHERYNLCRLCADCHNRVHSVSGPNGLTHGAVLNAKRLVDDAFYSPRAMAALRHRHGLSYGLEPLPDWALARRRRNPPCAGGEVMPINSRRKGKVGELELVGRLKELLPGALARRAQQYSGAESASDVIAPGLPNLWIECKRVQNLNLHNTMCKSRDQCGDLVPAVFHRKNNCEWLVSVRLDDVVAFAKQIVACAEGGGH